MRDEQVCGGSGMQTASRFTINVDTTPKVSPTKAPETAVIESPREKSPQGSLTQKSHEGEDQGRDSKN